MAKENFTIKKILKNEAAKILDKYHYLTDISKGFKSGFNYGLFENELLVGAIIFTGFPVPELAKGMFNLQRHEQEGLFELSRLCLTPDVQKSEHNIASWFVSRSIKLLRKETKVKAVLSYADSSFHKGTVYQACNFKYYGTAEPKKDFWFEQEDGSFIKHNRGKLKGLKGEWRARTIKHRFLITFDKNLILNWTEKEYQK
jgi:hypothetical protein